MHDLIIVEYVSACVSACIALVLYACTVVSVSSTSPDVYIYIQVCKRECTYA